AIGEIVLVVVGILIALSINNWNEYQKQRVLEREILNNLSINLERNVKLIESRLEVIFEFNNSSNVILSIIEKKDEYADSLKTHFDNVRLLGTFGMFLPEDGYESLKDAGFDILINTSIKSEIQTLFEVTYPTAMHIIKGFENSNPTEQDYISKNFIFEPGAPTLIPLDYGNLLKDNYYLGLIIRKQRYRSWHFELLDKCLIESKRLLDNIENELSKT
ncbi:MAG: hypothetical protein KAJ23_13700, partial [Maribacter sp.]|nr:hypothetical protein [Maribacter sp.]